MTPAAQTVIDIFSTLSTWVATHVVAGGELVRQAIPVMIVFGWVHLTADQQAVLFSAVSGIVAAITGTGTVSKPRVGERISQGVDKEMMARTGTGTGGGGGGDGMNAGVLLLALAFGMALLVGCSSNPKPRVVTAYQATEIGLGSVQDAELALYRSGTVPALTPQVHARINMALVQAFDLQIKFGHAILVWEPGALPAGYEMWLASIENVLQVVTEVVPKGSTVMTTTLDWARNVVALIRGLGQTVPPRLAAAVAQ